MMKSTLHKNLASGKKADLSIGERGKGGREEFFLGEKRDEGCVGSLSSIKIRKIG